MRNGEDIWVCDGMEFTIIKDVHWLSSLLNLRWKGCVTFMARLERKEGLYFCSTFNFNSRKRFHKLMNNFQLFMHGQNREMQRSLKERLIIKPGTINDIFKELGR